MDECFDGFLQRRCNDKKEVLEGKGQKAESVKVQDDEALLQQLRQQMKGLVSHYSASNSKLKLEIKFLN